MKNNKLPSIVIIMILTLITVVFWLMFTIYRAFSTETEIDVSTKVLSPINPNLDKSTLQKMQERISP